jgi:hypothetical protein
MKAHGIPTEESRQPVEVTPDDAIQAMCMVGVPAELMRKIMDQSRQEGISPTALVADALAKRLIKTEDSGTTERRLLTEDL